MKKIIQICSLFSLVFLFTAISASAQTSYGSEVDIPFAFNVGDEAHEAGTYIVRVEQRNIGGSILSIRDTKTNDVQSVILNISGEAGDKEVKLVFDTIEGRRYLTKVRTPDRTFALRKPKVEKGAGGSGSGTF